MIRRLVSFVVGLAALAAGAGVLVVSASFAIYALLRTYLGPAGAAGCVVFIAAIFLGVLALVMFGKAKGPTKTAGKAASGANGLVERLTGLLSDRPVVAASAAVAAGLLAWRNPTLVSTLLRAVDSRGNKRD